MDMPLSPSIGQNPSQVDLISASLIHASNTSPQLLELSVSQSMDHNPSLIQSPTPRGHYTIYTPEQKAQIAKYAVEKGNLREACDKFSEEYGIKVKESTARQFKKAYFDELNQGKRPEEIKALRGKRRGRPAKNRLIASVAVNDEQNPILAEAGTPVAEDAPTSFTSEDPGSYPVDTSGAAVTPMSSDESTERVTGSTYSQMVGELAVSAQVTVSS